MSAEWSVVPCDVCRRKTITDQPDEMVVCETCLDRWEAEEEAAPVVEVNELDDDDEDDDDFDFPDGEPEDFA